jgi:PAS domain S-box-containing protein
VNPVLPAEAVAGPGSIDAYDTPNFTASNVTMDSIDQLPLPYIELDAHGIITRANRATLALYPLSHGRLVGQTAWDMVAPDEKDRSFAAYCSALESGENPKAVLRSLCDCSGQFRTYEMHRSLIRDADGNAIGMRMLCVDVSEAKKELEEERRKSLWLESVLESISGAVVATDAIGYIRSVNPAAEVLLGGPVAEFKGMSIEQGLPILGFSPGGNCACTFNRWLEGPLKGIAIVHNRKREEIRVGLNISPIVDKENGSTAGVVLVLRKIATRR